MTKKDFYNKYSEYAKANQEASGVPYLVCLAQAAVESGWGDKTPGNNFFGIKTGKTWTGDKQLLTTTEIHNTAVVKYPEIISIRKLDNGKYEYRVKDWFRAYETPLSCFRDYAEFLKKRFIKAFAYREPESFIYSVQKEHPYKYATDPKYAQTVIKIIQQLRIFENEQ